MKNLHCKVSCAWNTWGLFVKCVASKYWWLVQPTYSALGLALGVADPALGHLAERLGAKSGAATAVSANLLLPLVALTLGFFHGRIGGAWVGAAAMTLGLIAGLA